MTAVQFMTNLFTSIFQGLNTISFFGVSIISFVFGALICVILVNFIVGLRK